jgi:hypothetical protein
VCIIYLQSIRNLITTVLNFQLDKVSVAGAERERESYGGEDGTHLSGYHTLSCGSCRRRKTGTAIFFVIYSGTGAERGGIILESNIAERQWLQLLSSGIVSLDFDDA